MQLVEMHAFAYCLLFVYLSELFHFLKSNMHCKSISYAYLGTNMGIL